MLRRNRAKVAKTSVQRVMRQQTRLAGFHYIIPRFYDALFHHLYSLNSRIYGPMAIIQSLTHHGMIPRSDEPLLAFYFYGYSVSFTGIPKDERVNSFFLKFRL